MANERNYDLNRKVNVRNTSNINTYFARISSSGDQKIAAKSTALMSFGEVLDQCHAGNRDFVGRDGKGKHATFYVLDKEVRFEAGLEEEDGSSTQEIIDEKAIVALFAIDGVDKFVEALKDKIVTMGERQTLRDVLGSGKVNAHDKIEIAEKYLRGEEIFIEPTKGRQATGAKDGQPAGKGRAKKGAEKILSAMEELEKEDDKENDKEDEEDDKEGEGA